MSNGNAKDIRKQLRNVTQELLPELLQTEVFKGLADKVQKTLRTELMARLEQIDKDIKESLKLMEERARDVQTFILNQVQSEMAQRVAQQNIITPTENTESTTLNIQG